MDTVVNDGQALPATGRAGTRHHDSALWSLPRRLTLQMTSAQQDGGTRIQIFWFYLCKVGGSGDVVAIFVWVSGLQQDGSKVSFTFTL